jgi:RNA polymerase sigma-70 factor (ECF subfamily)
VAEPSVHTTLLHQWLARMKAGDDTAREELLRSVCSRLEELARKMLRRFPNVRRWEDTDDVLQNALVHLMRTLERVQPESMRHFMGLAGQQIRRELLDLARHYYGPRGMGAHHESRHGNADTQALDRAEPAAPDVTPSDMEKWCAFHEAVDTLPIEEREVVSLIHYHGWTQAEVAELMQITVKTVQRRWQSALVKLHGVLKPHTDDL